MEKKNVNLTECDFCKKETKNAKGWFKLNFDTENKQSTLTIQDLAQYSHAYNHEGVSYLGDIHLDFCSLECLEKWCVMKITEPKLKDKNDDK